MKNNRISRLTALRNKLAQIEVPEYPNDFEVLINSWIAEATPIIRQEGAELFQDFQNVTTKPVRSRVVRYLEGSMFEMSEQENRRQWELDVAEGQELKQNILGFLDGLLSLLEKPHLSVSFYVVSMVILVTLPLLVFLLTKDLLITGFIFITTLLIFLIIGALKLRQDEALSESDFLQQENFSLNKIVALATIIPCILSLFAFFGYSQFRDLFSAPGLSSDPDASELLEAATDTPILSTSMPPTNTPIPPTPTTRNDILPNGEVVSPESLAKFIGGKPEFWTKRGPVVWGYWDEGNNMTFRHPGNNTILTCWAGFSEPKNANDCSIIIPEADNLTRYVKCPPGTQAEFEADGVGFHLIDYTGFFQ